MNMESKRIRLSVNLEETRNEISKFEFALWQNSMIESSIDDNFINT